VIVAAGSQSMYGFAVILINSPDELMETEFGSRGSSAQVAVVNSN